MPACRYLAAQRGPLTSSHAFEVWKKAARVSGYVAFEEFDESEIDLPEAKPTIPHPRA